MGFANLLRPEVREFTWGSFSLGRDVERLEAVYVAGAPEAAVLYVARIVEATSTHALASAGLRATTNLYATLTTLEDLGLLDEFDWYVGHVLRRLGNTVRHVNDVTDARDAEVVAGLLGGWLDYIFVRCPLGPRLPSVATDEAVWPPLGASRVPGLLRALERFVHANGVLDAASEEALTASDSGRSPGHRALVSLAAEVLIGRREFEFAERLLTHGLSAAPEDLRLTQLLGLLASRRGDLAGAATILEPLASGGQIDEETAGILAGVYKRMAAAEGDPGTLRRSARLYRQGWKSSGRQNAYLGLNAAAVELLLGDVDAAGETASRVRDLLLQREAAIRGSGAGLGPVPYYTQVMAAEALLLAGELDAAVERYRTAFREHAARRGDIEGTSRQADDILRVQGHSKSLHQLL